MPTVFVRRGGFTFCCLLAGLRFLTGPTAPPAFGAQYEACKFFSELPDDCAGAELRKFDNLRNYRYEEIDLFARDPLKKVLYVSTYNTTGQNAGEDTRNSAPKAIAQSVDSKRVAKQFQALSAAISPPRYWTLDWLSDRVGEVRNFGGLDAAWMGNSLAPRVAAASKSSALAYRSVLVARTAVEGFKKGSQVYLLDDPKDRTWIMVAYTDKDSPGLTIDKLELARRRFETAPGLEIPHREARQGPDPGAEGRFHSCDARRPGGHLPSDWPEAEQFRAVISGSRSRGALPRHTQSDC